MFSICGRSRRPIGFVTLATRETKNQKGGVKSRSTRVPGRVGSLPGCRPESHVRCVAETSSAISAPAFAAPPTDVAVVQLRWSAIFARVELNDIGVKITCKRRHECRLIAAGSQHDVVRLEPMRATHDDETIIVSRDRVDAPTPSNGKIKSVGVGLEVVGHLILC